MNAIKASTAPRTVLAIGESIEKQVERTSITLQRNTATTWTVTVYEGTRRIDDQCSTFENEQAAALTASAYYQLALGETLEPAADPAAPLAPGEIREHTAGPIAIRIFQTAQAGVMIQGRRSGAIDTALCSRHDHEWNALRAYAALVAAHPAA